MKWHKKGLIFAPSKKHSFCKTRVMVPTPYLINDKVIRLYCGFCDEAGISRIGYVDVNSENPSEIINISEKPLLDIGEDGMFDDNGLCPTSIFKKDNKLYMYYFGFQKGVKIPFYMFSGLAISEDNGNTFERIQRTPILDRSNKEPLMRSGPFVLYDDSENNFKVWYPCGVKFINICNKKVHTYSVNYLESKDGINWGREGKAVLLPQNEDEYGFGRPFIIKKNHNLYKFFYSIRTKSKGYRLGYAESTDGIDWVRKDHLMQINIGKNGWDSEMICYCSPFKYKDKIYLFYNGNNLGATGFGYAELERTELW